jgi:hypothetical protein
VRIAALSRSGAAMTLVPPRLTEQKARGDDAPDLARALVMAAVARAVAADRAATVALEPGTVELRLATGEIFHLSERTVTRIA